MPEITLNELIQDEIARLAEANEISTKALEDFAYFVIANHKKKDPKPKATKPKASKSTTSKSGKKPKIKPLTATQLKKAVYERFEVTNTTELKKSGSFKMATDGMDNLNFSAKETWEKLYRDFIGIIPGEENQQGYGCINGINIFNYFKPWQVFGLDPQTSTDDDVKKSYRELSKIYHPDVPETGDSRIFERINTMYRSITAEA